jgi:hypothetical protein
MLQNSRYQNENGSEEIDIGIGIGSRTLNSLIFNYRKTKRRCVWVHERQLEQEDDELMMDDE